MQKKNNLEVKNKQVGRDEHGKFIIGNKLARSKMFSIDDFMDGVDFVADETGVPFPIQLMRMAYVDAKLMGKVLDKFVANVSTDVKDKKQLIQVIIQSYLGSPGDVEKVIDIPSPTSKVSVIVGEQNTSQKDTNSNTNII